MPKPDWFYKHVEIPAKLVYYELADGRRSVKLCYPHADLKERCLAYVDSWNEDFPDNKIRFCAIEDVVFPEGT